LLGDRLTLLHPVPFTEVRGAQFYESFIDRSRWPEFMRLGYRAARETLTKLERNAARGARGRKIARMVADGKARGEKKKLTP